MEREFMIETITTVDGKTGVTVRYNCVTCDDEDPEMKISVSFPRSVPTAFKKAMGAKKYDTFRMNLEGLSRQTTIE